MYRNYISVIYLGFDELNILPYYNTHTPAYYNYSTNNTDNAYKVL